MCTVCGMLHVPGGGEGHLWDLLGAAAHLVPCCPCCQDGARLWSRAGTQLPTTGARRAEGWGWGWAGGQETLDLMPGDSLGSKRIPGLGRWKRWHKEGSVCVLRVPTLHPRSRKSIGVVWKTQTFCLRALGEPTKAVADAASLAGCCCPGAWIPGALLPACREPWTTPRDHGMPGSGETLC